MLAAPDGGDDPAAAAALAYALLPGACRVAAQLGMLRSAWRASRWCTVVPGAENPDTLVAAQLWLEVRSFPWRRLSHVAANILMNTRAAVLHEYGADSQVARRDRTWAHTLVLDVFAYGDVDTDREAGGHRSASRVRLGYLSEQALIRQGSAQGLSSTEELLGVLVWASESGVISEQDRDLLLCLVEEAWASQERGSMSRRVGRGCGGFTARELTTRVADRVGVSEVTVRRRSARAVRALAAAAADYVTYAA